jgi:hypothetical protein
MNKGWVLLIGCILLIPVAVYAIAGSCPEGVCYDSSACGIVMHDDSSECRTGGYCAPDWTDPGDACDTGYTCENGYCYVGITPSQCTTQRGIYCDGGMCITSEDQTKLSAACIVSSSQNIDTGKDTTVNYYFKNLTINAAAKLWFYNSLASSGGGGSAGTGGDKEDSGGAGGAGGTGGAKLKAGTKGGGDHNGCGSADCHGGNKAGGAGGKAGANVNLNVKEVLNNYGVLSVEGESGSYGQRGEDACDSSGEWGNTGTGGGGGGGGGALSIFAVIINGTGQYQANGGAGRSGGAGGGEDCDCGSSTDHGGTGGGGGGGNGGTIIFSAQKIDPKIDMTHIDISGISPLIFFLKSGAGGGRHYDGCDWSEGGSDGGAGTASQTTMTGTVLDTRENIDFITKLEIPNACNDEYDNDYDSLIDMEDPDCYNLQSDLIYKGICPSSNYISSYASVNNNGYISTGINSAYRSASNGYDGCCGDDDWLNGGFER